MQAILPDETAICLYNFLVEIGDEVISVACTRKRFGEAFAPDLRSRVSFGDAKAWCFCPKKEGAVQENLRRTIEHQIDEQRQAADWRDAFSTKQQDKARFFITLVTSETFAIGLSLNTMPPQRWLWAPSAITFLICFAACFWSIYHFAWVVAPRTFRAVDEGKKLDGAADEETIMRATLENTERQNKNLDRIVDEQGMHLKRGIRSFFAFNVVFAIALFVSRLAWFFPPD